MPTIKINNIGRIKKLCPHEYSCGDCEKPFPMHFMVKNSVWRFANKTMEERKKILCISCLQKRLGRNLTLDDFGRWGTSACLFFFGIFIAQQDKVQIDFPENFLQEL